MSEIFPGIEKLNTEYDFTETQFKIFFTEHLILTLLYAALFILVSVNIWIILVRQGKWRTLPLLLFYVMAFIAISTRLIACIWIYTEANWVFAVYFMQPLAKIAVGLTQAWMIFELKVRIRQARLSL